MEHNDGFRAIRSRAAAWLFTAVLGAGLVAGAGAMGAEAPPGFQPSSRLLDLSGLAWLGGDRFLAVHDAKHPEEDERTRVSLLILPSSLAGILWKPLDPRFRGSKSSDLESASRIPGTNKVLLVESGDDAGPYRRIFLAEVANDEVTMVDVIEWSAFADAYNVEGTAVARTDAGYLLIWAERNSGKQTTDVKWTDLTLEPFAVGGAGVSSARFALPADLVDGNGRPLYDRPIVGLDVDSAGILYGVAAFDVSGLASDPDNGPYRSAVFRIGGVDDGRVSLDPQPSLLVTIDGFKTESVVVREDGGRTQLFIGTDDENYGGTLRLTPVFDLR